MPEELLEFILTQPDKVLLELLGWLRGDDPRNVVDELDAVITRQGIKGA